VKGKALRILRTNSSEATFEENILNFKIQLLDRGCPCNLIEELLSQIKFTGRVSALRYNNKTKQNKSCPL